MMIAKVLGTIYLSVLFLLSIWYIYCQISDAIDRVRARKRMMEAKTFEKPYEPVYDVVGKSTTVFLAPLMPVMSEDLEPESVTALEPEPDVFPSEVEAHLNLSIAIADDEPEMYPDDNMELSQGLTFEQISHAVEVVEGKKSGENEEYFAGETLAVMPNDFLNMICLQENYEAKVKKLIAGYLDFPGKMKPVPAVVANFDIKNYV
jgi:hypothetical protein